MALKPVPPSAPAGRPERSRFSDRWEDSSPSDESQASGRSRTTAGYAGYGSAGWLVPQDDRRAKPPEPEWNPPAPATRPQPAAASPSGKGWWVFALLVVFIVRACMVSNSDKSKDHRTRPLPPSHYTPPPSDVWKQRDELRQKMQSEFPQTVLPPGPSERLPGAFPDPDPVLPPPATDSWDSWRPGPPDAAPAAPKGRGTKPDLWDHWDRPAAPDPVPGRSGERW
jgi:hypothetical protein